MGNYIFLSHAHKDVTFVEDLEKRLNNRHIRTWRDLSGISAGAPFEPVIKQAITESQIVLVVISEASLKSDWVTREIQMGLDAGKTIIPYLYDVGMCNLPENLKHLNALSHHSPADFERLVGDIKKDHSEVCVSDDLVGQTLLGNENITFSQAAVQVRAPLGKMIATFGPDEKEVPLIGIPLQRTLHCETYLIGRANDTLEWRSIIQMGLQITQKVDTTFPVEVAGFLFSEHGRDFPLRLILVRGPSQIARTEGSAPSLQFTLGAKEEWSEVISAAENAIHLYHEGRRSPSIHLFPKGPAPVFYGLGARLGRFYNVTAYQFHGPRATPQYTPVVTSP